MPRLRSTLRSLAPGGAVLVTMLMLAPPAAAAGKPDFEAPFGCGQDWQAETRSGHSPSIYSVDFNREDDFQVPVRASAPGRVSVVTDVGDSSYGKYIRIEHGQGWETLYAHLDRQFVVVGQRVDQGAVVGTLGASGGTTGPHLHFEQRLGGTVEPAVFHQTALDYNSTINSFNCGDVPIAGDWNGDGRTQVGVFRPGNGHNSFRLRRPDGDATVIRLGRPGDIPVTGDWNGNGTSDVGLWRQSTQTFVLRSDNGDLREIAMGTVRDVPVTGDWNGNGVTDVGVFTPGQQVFRLRSADGSVTRREFGSVGSTPVTGDWDADGRTDIGVFDKASGSWSYPTGPGTKQTFTFGPVGGIPVAGDWDGDGMDTPGTWGPGNAEFRLLEGSKTLQLRFGRPRS